MNWMIYFEGLLACIAIAAIAWLISVIKHDASIVDSFWSVFFLAAGLIYFEPAGWREWIVLALLAVWAIRLSSHITLRSIGEEEDRRYQDIRAKYSPGFAYKSFFIIFLFQAVLAWVLTLPLFAIFSEPAEFGLLAMIATLIVLFGLTFEAVGDWQLKRFKDNPDNKGKVMDRGLWAYTRHPNYFGEATLWWGFALFAVAEGYWWTLFAPLLLTGMLLRFSGVSLLESTITERRPAYRHYKETTNAFIPGPKKSSNSAQVSEGHS